MRRHHAHATRLTQWRSGADEFASSRIRSSKRRYLSSIEKCSRRLVRIFRSILNQRLKEVDPGGADTGRGGNDRLILGLDLKVFRGGESKAES
jgi:hypothetical protein